MKPHKLLKPAVSLILLSLALWGCATIMHGSTQNIGISSSPTSAKVLVDGREYGSTPLFAELLRGDEHIVTVELTGYQKVEFTITKSVSGWVWGNIIFGGVIGLAFDALSGGLYDLSPEQIRAELKKEGVGAIEKDGTIYLVTVLRPNPDWQKIGTLSRQK